ncbi:MAG: hypothetical protein KDA89_03880 [Planctomycetaceae bacterium]|nr:hypothetical protein [Planctomycetaceae bacterium]
MANLDPESGCNFAPDEFLISLMGVFRRSGLFSVAPANWLRGIWRKFTNRTANVRLSERDVDCRHCFAAESIRRRPVSARKMTWAKRTDLPVFRGVSWTIGPEFVNMSPGSAGGLYCGGQSEVRSPMHE